MNKSPQNFDNAHYPLEIAGQAMSGLIAQAAQRIAEFLDTLSEQPTSNLERAEQLARAVAEPLPVVGQSFDSLLEQLFERVFPVALNTTSPGYFAYIPGGGLPHAALADLISLTTNRYVGLWMGAPLVAQIEATVIRWLCDIVGYEAQAGGFLTSGGSLANWAALVVARHSRLPENFLSGVIYTSDQAHHSVDKSAMLAGFPRGNVRKVEVDGEFRVRLDRLRQVIAEDRSRGLTPLAVIAHAGTTNTGAVDDLQRVADLAADERLWFHVDAAYGGFFLLTDQGRSVMRGISRADSITLDPHKGLFLPYGTGCLLVRQQDQLRQTFAWRGEYMTAAASEEFVDFCDISPELTRDFRGLRIWLPLKMHGVQPFRECLQEKLELARYAAMELRKLDRIEIVADPQLSILAFRFQRAGLSNEQLNAFNRELLARINASRRVLLTPTTLDEKFVIRLCVLSFRTHRDRIDELLELVRKAAREVSGES